MAQLIMRNRFKVLKPIGWGGRREIGEFVFMTDEEAAAFGDEYVVPAPEPVTTGEPEQSGEESAETETSEEPGKVEGEAAVKPKSSRKAKK